MEGRPNNPLEKYVFDASYKKHHAIGVAASLLLPGIPLYPIWWPLVSAIGIEGAAVITLAAQGGLLTILPDRFASYMAAKDLARERPRLPEVKPPEKATSDPFLKIEVKGGFTLSLAKNKRSAFVTIHGIDGKKWANPRDLEKYRDAKLRLITAMDIDEKLAAAAIDHLNVLFCKAVSNHRREGEFMRNWDTEAIKDRMINYELELRSKYKL